MNADTLTPRTVRLGTSTKGGGIFDEVPIMS
jgi:hypothetical protein